MPPKTQTRPPTQALTVQSQATKLPAVKASPVTPVKPRRLAPEVKVLLAGLSPVLDETPSASELAAMEVLWDTVNPNLKGLLRAKVINAE